MSTLSILPDAQRIRDAIVSGGSPSWAIFSYAAGTPTLKLHESGDDLLEFQESFEDAQIHYGFLRVQQGDLHKFVLVLWCGEAVPVTKRGQLQAHTQDIKRLFHGYHVQIDARNENDLDPTTILKKVRSSAGSKYASHPSNQKAAYQDNEPPASVGSVYEPVQTNPGKLDGGPRMMPGAVGGTAADIRAERQRREKEQMEAERARFNAQDRDEGPAKVGSSWKPVQTAPKPFTSRPGMFNKPAPPATAPKPSFGSKPSWGSKPPVAAKPAGFGSARSAAGPAVSAMYGAARQELTLGSAEDEDPDASVGTNYIPVKLTPQPLSASKRGSYEPPEEPAGADAIRKARQAYDRELMEREKKQAYAQDRPDELDGLSGADRIRKQREMEDAELRRREEERIKQSGQSLEADDQVVGNAQDVRREREEYDRQLREREEERIRRWEANEASEGGAGSRGPGMPALPGRPAAPATGFGKLSAPSSGAASRASSTVTSPVPGGPRKTSTGGLGATANWTMPGAAASTAPAPAAREPSPPPQPPRPSATVEQAVVSQMGNIKIEDAEPALPPRPSIPQASEPAREPEPEPEPAQDAPQGDITVVALYDYDASEDNELSFREGEKIINVQKLGDDWWLGSTMDGSAQGLFPANFVEEVSNVVSLARAEAGLDQPGEANGMSSGIVCKAVYDFPGTDDQEIPLKEGDRIVEVEKASEEWWWGRVEGSSDAGYFPANHVEEV